MVLRLGIVFACLGLFVAFLCLVNILRSLRLVSLLHFLHSVKFVELQVLCFFISRVSPMFVKV